MTGRSKADLARSQKMIEDAARQGYGPDTDLPEARTQAQFLHRAGCSIAAIAALFEVSAEQARMWVRGVSSKPINDEEWQLVQWLRAHKLDPTAAQQALDGLREQYAKLGRRSR